MASQRKEYNFLFNRTLAELFVKWFSFFLNIVIPDCPISVVEIKTTDLAFWSKVTDPNLVVRLVKI